MLSPLLFCYPCGLLLICPNGPRMSGGGWFKFIWTCGHPFGLLVVRLFSPSNKRMVSAGRCCRREAAEYRSPCNRLLRIPGWRRNGQDTLIVLCFDCFLFDNRNRVGGLSQTKSRMTVVNRDHPSCHPTNMFSRLKTK